MSDTRRDKCFSKLRGIILEVVSFLMFLAIGSIDIFTQNLTLDRFCLLNYSPDQCFDSTNSSIEGDVQSSAADYLMYQLLILRVTEVLLSFTVGFWSDLHGRKPVIMASIIGYAVTNFIYLLLALFPDAPMCFLVLAALPSALTGSKQVFNLGIYSFIKDNTPSKRISLRITIVGGLVMLGEDLSSLLMSQLLDKLGYAAVFGFSIFLLLSTLLITQFFLHDASSFPATNFKSKLKDIWIAVFATSMTQIGSIGFKNSTRLVAGWNASIFSYQNALATGCKTIGIILFPLLSIYFHLNDAVIAVFSLILKSSYDIGIAFSTNTASLFTVTMLLAPGVLYIVANRGFIIKCAPLNEIGKGQLMAFHDVSMLLVGSIFSVAANRIYVATISTFPGFIFMLSGLVLLPPAIAYFYRWIAFDMKRNNVVLEKCDVPLEDNTNIIVDVTHKEEISKR